MSLFDDLIVDALFSGIGPSTTRGWLILFTIGGLALAVTSGRNLPRHQLRCILGTVRRSRSLREQSR